MKRIYIFILLCLLVINANAESVLIDGIYYNLIEKERIAEVSSNPNYYSGNVVIPSSVSYGGYSYSVTSIGKNAFKDCRGLESISIPGSVTYIGDFAFWECNGLTSVHINDISAWYNIKFASNQSNPLQYAHHLYLANEEIKDLIIPNNVTSIGVAAFAGCSGLTSVTIPNSVTSIGNAAFIGCSGLTSVTIPNSVTSIGGAAFFECSSLTSITISNNVTSIEQSAFWGCSNLTSVSIPNSVTNIGIDAFGNCSGLTSITIPNSVTSIGNGAFMGCSLTSVICKIEKPFEIDTSVFYGNPSAVLQVPQGTKDSYLSYPGWTEYFNEIVEYGGTTTYTLSITSSGSGSVTYSGNTFSNTTRNYTINEGTSATLTFTPNSGYRIGSVKINGINYTSYLSNNQYTINNVSRNTTVEVTFEAIPVTTYTLSITSSYGGDVSYTNSTIVGGETHNFSVKEGTYISISITPYDGYRIKALYVNGTDISFSQSGGVLKLEMDSDISVSVEFETIPSQFVLNVEVVGGEGGYIVYNGPYSINLNKLVDRSWSYSVDEGSDIPLAFTPKEGYVLKSVTVNDVDVTSKIINNRYTISDINMKTSVKATFESTQQWVYFLDIESSEGGSVVYSGNTISNGQMTFTILEGTSITFTITPNSGYKVGSLKVNNVDVTSYIDNNTYTISNVNKDITVEVTFEAISPTTYTLSITSTGSGYITYSGNTINGNGVTKNYTVNEGSSATLSFTPNSGYRIGSVKINGINYTSYVSNNQYTINNVSRNTTVEVIFEAIPPTSYSLNITASGKGNVVYAGNTISGTTRTYNVTEGSSATLTFNPTTGYRIGSVKVNGTDVTSKISNNQYTISSITKNTTVSVTYEAIPPTTYTLSITSTGGGYVTYSGTTVNGTTRSYTVNSGASATLAFDANSGYRIGSVKVNGADVTSSISNNKYTISNITKNTTVSATFEAIPVTTYTLSISTSGNGSVTYSGNTINGNGATKSYSVNEGSSATFSFTPNSGYRIGSVKVNGADVTSSISSNKYTISNITKNTTVSVTFEAIPPTTYTLSITSTGGGYVTYSGTTVNGTTRSYTVNSGASATLAFDANSGYRIGSVKVNGADVTSSISSNKYTISNITKNTTVSVTFEAIPVTTYTLSISTSGNGSVTYSGNTINGNGATKSYSVNEGSSATFSFTPNSGYRIGSVKINGINYTSFLSNNQYTISNVNKDYTVEVVFEAIPTTYTLSITSLGNGYVAYSGDFVTDMTKTYTVNEGTTATLTFIPNSGYRMGNVKVNNVDVTSSVASNKYTISNINKNTTVSAIFEEIPADNVAYNGVNYRVLSTADKTVNVANGSYGQSLEIPASFAASGSTWQVRGMDRDVMTNNPQLAAIVWNPTVAFSNSISNPNFLLYVTSAQYAPSSVGNVIVNGTANIITLSEGNDFYCPQEFTAQSIRYTHNYSMTTGIGECQGWETIALPFDVQTITHATKGEIMPFAKWNSGDSRRPFWLYELTGDGWQEAETIKAYTPYVISMPNNDQYYDAARLNGDVTFSAKNVTVGVTAVKTASYQGKVFTPNFSATSASTGIYALNVRNQWTTATNNQKEGSTFVRNLRALHPFEAYMSVPNYTRSSFGIFENMATTIRGVKELLDEKRMKGIYNMKGQKINVEADGNLPAGVYIINGQKAIVK